MARRMEIELTSDRGDGTWTWRAAGARQPRGTLDAKLLPPSTHVGDVLRAEVEGFLDGLSIVAVLPPKSARPEPEKIELLAPRSEGPLVTARVSRAPRGERSPRGRRERGERGDRGDRDRERFERRPGRGRPDHGSDRSDRSDRSERSDHRRERPSPAPVNAKPKPKRLRPGKVHRTQLLENLPPEQQPIAEQLFQGGIPGVRQAIEKQNEQLQAEGKPQVSPEPLLEIAEKLRSRVQTALWRDRADAALAHIDDLDLRDLRSVVNAAGDAGRDSDARAVADQLREALGTRVEKEQAAWVEEVAENLREGRVVRALRLSSRPPKAGSPLPPDLAGQLIHATEAALTADTNPQRWATVLDALAYSPIRRRVVPESLPTKVGPELRTTIARFGVQLPEIAHIFDIEPEAAPSRERPRPPRRTPRKAQGTTGSSPRPRRPRKETNGSGPAERPAAEQTSDEPTAPADEATPTAETPTADTAPATPTVEEPTLETESPAEPTDGDDTQPAAPAETSDQPTVDGEPDDAEQPEQVTS